MPSGYSSIIFDEFAEHNDEFEFIRIYNFEILRFGWSVKIVNFKQYLFFRFL